MTTSIQQLLGNPESFLNEVFKYLEWEEIDVEQFELDHICYRVSLKERYSELKQELLKLGSLLTENEINGRPIATFKLNKPILFENRKIWCLELPSPKPGSNYSEGFEHAEFVIDVPFENFVNLYPNSFFDKKGLSKKVNADLRIQFGELSVKFHHHSLEYVIKFLD